MESIRIYNDRGEIRFSSQHDEIGTSVELDSEACRACHANGQQPTVFPAGEQGQIYTRGDRRCPRNSEPDSQRSGVCIGRLSRCRTSGCSECSTSSCRWKMWTQAMSAATWRSGLVGLAIIFISALVIALIVYHAIHVPAKKLQRGTEALAAGNLDVSDRPASARTSSGSWPGRSTNGPQSQDGRRRVARLVSDAGGPGREEDGRAGVDQSTDDPGGDVPPHSDGWPRPWRTSSTILCPGS